MISLRLNFFFPIIAVVAYIIGTAAAFNDSEKCQHSCGSIKLPYPFGFSSGCPIRFNCSETGVFQIGQFAVNNVTASSIFVGVPPECNRSIETIGPLYGELHAPLWHNSLLLNDCRRPLNSCLIKQSFLQSELNMSSCDSMGHVSCFSGDENNSKQIKHIKLEDVRRSGCRSLFSSIAFESVGQHSGVSLEFERVQLEWWLKGGCGNDSCSSNANCTDVVTADGGLGHRCACRENFVGDGFINGVSCKSTSHCSGSRFIPGRCKGSKAGVLVGGIIAGASFASLLAVLFFCIRRRNASSKSVSSAKRLLSEAVGNSSVLFFPYKDIEKATNNFSEKQMLGTGAYGTVYAGKLHNDEWVAIKRLRHRDTDSMDQVMNEIKLLSFVSHPNLVRLLGCCIEQGGPVLVYEFMPNGTLSQHLQRERGDGLPWMVRLTIATQTAKAIAFLHSSMNPPIYHRDIKSSNILLDYNFNSKVADFGLSRLGLTEISHISTAPQGTPGYLDPQYHQYFHLSDKSDVYSFGVVLVEIITSLKVVDFNRQHSDVNLAALAIDRIGRGCVDEIIDPTMEPNRDAWTVSSIHSVSELAFRCLAFHGDMRPTMMEVAEELEQIRLSAWLPNMCVDSPTASHRSLSEFGSQRSVKKSSVGSRRVIVPQKLADCLTPLEEISDNAASPVSVYDQNSPSEHVLLGNLAR